MDRLDTDTMKAIALYKANNRHMTHQGIADRFNVKEHQVRYAIKKYAEDANTIVGTKKGREIASRALAHFGKDVETLSHQVSLCIQQLETEEIALSSRVELLAKIANIKAKLTDFELQKHLKRVDASLIQMLIRKFKPEADNEEVIKIYNEVYNEWKQNFKNLP